MPRIKISQAAKEFNVSISTVVEQLQKKGITIDATSPNTRLDDASYAILVEAFQPDKDRIAKIRNGNNNNTTQGKPESTHAAAPAPVKEEPEKPAATAPGIRVLGHIKLDKNNNPIVTKEPEEPKVKTEAAAPAPAPAPAPCTRSGCRETEG